MDITNLESDNSNEVNGVLINDTKKTEENILEAIKSIHIRVEKRNARKSRTILENLDLLYKDEGDWKKFLKYLKQTLCANGSLDKKQKTLMIFGDHRDKLKEFIINKKLAKEEQIKIHGF
jgi:translation initiation factor SUI1